MASHNRGEKKNKITAVEVIIVVASHFAFRLTAPLACQSRIIGPIAGWASSQSCKRCEPREAAYAASRINGTVGITGSTMPMMPRPKLV